MPMHRRALIKLGVLTSTGLSRHAQAQSKVAPATNPSPQPLEAYAALPAAKGARLSPNGRLLAAIEPVRGRHAIVIRSLDEKKAPVAIEMGIGEPQWLIWKTDQRLVVSLRVVNESGHQSTLVDTRLISFDADGRDLVKLVQSDKGDFTPQIQDRVISTLPSDLNHLLLELPKIGRGYRLQVSPSVAHDRYLHPEAVLVNIHTGQTRTVVAQHGLINHWIADAQGQIRLGWALQRDKSLDVLVRDTLDSPWRKLQTLSLNKGQVFDPLAFVDGRTDQLYVLSNHQSGLASIHEFDINSRTFGKALSINTPYDVVPTVQHGRLLGHVLSTGSTPIYLDPAWAADVRLIQKALPDASISVVDCSTDGQRVLAQVAKGNEPSDFWLLTRGHGKTELEPVTDTYPLLAPNLIAPSRWVSYTARDGLKIPALLTLPVGQPKGQAIPFVVLPHDGPSSHDTAGFSFRVQFLTSRGYGVLQPQFRGSTGHGQSFLTEGYQQWGKAMQDDVTDGTRWLIEQKLADPQRIALLGHGYGGYAALFGLVKEPALYRCAVGFAPITDLPEFVDNRYNFVFGELNVPLIGTNVSQLAQYSPTSQAQRIGQPVLLIHGRKDYTVHITQSELMDSALKKANKAVQTVYLDNADHGLNQAADRLAYLKAVEAFLSAHLRPSMPPLTN